MDLKYASRETPQVGDIVVPTVWSGTARHNTKDLPLLAEFKHRVLKVGSARILLGDTNCPICTSSAPGRRYYLPHNFTLVRRAGRKKKGA